MFITEEDYKVVVGEQALAILSQADEANRQNAELAAIEEMSGYLRPRYDVNSIFGSTAAARNRMVVTYACDIALYHLTASMPGRMGTEIRKERYERALEWLSGVQSGRIVPDLPHAVTSQGTDASPLRYGSEHRRTNTW